MTFSPGDIVASAALMVAIGGFGWKILEHLLGRGDQAASTWAKRLEDLRMEVSAKIGLLHVRVDAIRDEYVRRDDLHPQLDRLAERIEALAGRLDDLLAMMATDRAKGR